MTNKPYFGGSSSGTTSLNQVVFVQSAAQLAGTLDSTKEYVIDGIIDMGSQSIEIPAGGLNIRGWNFNVSKLISSENNYTMFTSPVGGSGDVLGTDYSIEVTGTNSKVYDLKSVNGFQAFEFERINYNDCSSLGSIDNYRQGLEVGTGRFGGSPSLELIGVWNGFRITTSIVRVLDSGMTEPLFKAGAGFSMNNRFLTDINVDLPASAAFFDFSASNFPTPSTIQVTGAIVTRNGVSDPNDTNLTPNITAAELPCAWSNNNGLDDTFEGGSSTISAAAATTILVQNDFYDLNGTYTPTDLQHFDAPANGQLRHLGNNPRNYNLIADFVIQGTRNDELDIKIVKWDNSAAGFVDLFTKRRTVNNLSGARDVAIFFINFQITLDQNDYVKLQVANATSTANVEAEIDSFYMLQER